MTTEEEHKEKLTNEFRNGQDAQILLNGVENLLAMYKADLFRDLTDTKPDQIEEREEVYRQLKTIEFVERKLSTAIQTGKWAKQQLTSFDKAKQLINNVIG